MTAVFCAHCGKRIQPDSRFCTQCGESVETGAQRPPIVNVTEGPTKWSGALDSETVDTRYEATDPLPIVKKLTTRHPVPGIISITGNVLAWPSLMLAMAVISGVRRRAFFGLSESQEQTLGFGVLLFFLGSAIGVVSLGFGIAATTQNVKSRVTGIVGMVLSGLLLLTGVFYWVALIAQQA